MRCLTVPEEIHSQGGAWWTWNWHTGKWAMLESVFFKLQTSDESTFCEGAVAKGARRGVSAPGSTPWRAEPAPNTAF